MTKSKCLTRWLLAALLTTTAVSLAADEPAPPKPAEPGTLVVIDSAGKERILKTWKIVLGTRHLTWLAAPEAGKEPEIKEPPENVDPRPRGGPAPRIAARPAVGPEALAFREERSTRLSDGVLTLIPLERLLSLEFDSKDPKEPTVTARVAGGKEAGLNVVLKGPTKYQGINKLVLKEKIDKGTEGIAEMIYSGGVPKGGIQAIRFPAPKVEALAAGRPALVVIADKEKTKLAVSDLRAMYQLHDGSERLASVLMFKKTVKRDLAKLAKIEAIESETQDTVWQMTLKDGGEDSLSLHKTVSLDGKQAHLEGLIGKVPAGFKLFPLHSIVSIEFDKTAEPGK